MLRKRYKNQKVNQENNFVFGTTQRYTSMLHRENKKYLAKKYYHRSYEKFKFCLNFHFPNDQKGVTIIDSGQSRGSIFLHGCASPIDVSTATHQCNHRFGSLHFIRMVFPTYHLSGCSGSHGG